MKKKKKEGRKVDVTYAWCSMKRGSKAEYSSGHMWPLYGASVV